MKAVADHSFSVQLPKPAQLAAVQAGLATLAAGEYTYSVGTQGSGNGQFSLPSGMALDADGNLLVADPGNNRVQKLSATGAYLGQFGSGQFRDVKDVKVDSAGNIYVPDSSNYRVQKFDKKTSTSSFSLAPTATETGSLEALLASAWMPWTICTWSATTVCKSSTPQAAFSGAPARLSRAS
ncbi:hypothetical protein ABPG77_006958 [Micractinium sp. CCAP 211/92]